MTFLPMPPGGYGPTGYGRRGVDLGRPTFGVGRMGSFPQIPGGWGVPSPEQEGPRSNSRMGGIADALANPVTVESGGWGEALAEALALGIRGRAARGEREREEFTANEERETERGRRQALADALQGFDPNNPQAVLPGLARGAPDEAFDLAQALIGEGGRQPETRVTQSGTFWRQGADGAPQIMGRDPNWQPPAALQSPQAGMPVRGAAGYVWGPTGPDGMPTMQRAQGGPAETQYNQAQAQRSRAALSRLEDQQNVIGAIQRARQLAGNGETGAIGAVMRGVPGTQAFDLDAQLDIIRANIGFAELMEMRANSPTGGALGAVTERELALLQSVLESLNQAQSRPQFMAGLDRLEQTYRASLARIQQAYQQDFGAQAPGQGEAPPEGYVGGNGIPVIELD